MTIPSKLHNCKMPPLFCGCYAAAMHCSVAAMWFTALIGEEEVCGVWQWMFSEAGFLKSMYLLILWAAKCLLLLRHISKKHCLLWYQNQVFSGTLSLKRIAGSPWRLKGNLGPPCFLRKVTSACIHCSVTPQFHNTRHWQWCLTKHLHEAQVPTDWKHILV